MRQVGFKLVCHVLSFVIGVLINSKPKSDMHWHQCWTHVDMDNTHWYYIDATSDAPRLSRDTYADGCKHHVLTSQTVSPGAGAAIFLTDGLYPTFPILGSRQCLPSDFDFTVTKPLAPNCAALVRDQSLPKKCEGAPLLALFYNCYAYRYGRTGFVC